MDSLSCRAVISLAILSCLDAAASARASDFDVIFSELHFHPQSGEDRDEFIELFNRGPTAVDLTSWTFTEGVSMLLPAGTVLEPKAYLVISPDRAHTIARYSLPPELVVGVYAGRLDNDGELLTLVNAAGDIISRVHYQDGGTWPSRPDGQGPSLEILDPHAVPDTGRSWASSVWVGGTPGRANSRQTAPAARTILVGAQDNWRYQKGTQEASSPNNLAWTTVGFNDAAWGSAPGAFGYGNQPFETELADMQGLYSTVYLRNRFTITAEQLDGVRSGELSMTLIVRYDDACVAYMNGVEVGRQNASNAGTPPPFDAIADASGGGQAIIPLDAYADSLAAGQGVIAVHGLNSATNSADFLIEAELSIVERPEPTGEVDSPLSINEVRPTEGATPGFIEIHNAGAGTLSLNQHALLDAAGHRFDIANGTSIPGGARMSFAAAQLGFAPTLGTGALVLVRRDAAQGRDAFVASIDPRVVPAGVTGVSYGRVPDGGDDEYLLTTPSPAGTNQVTLNVDVVLNEFQYHPPFVAPGGGCEASCSDLRQWIEVHNRGVAAVNIAGWSLSKGVELTLPASPALNVPAGGFLVLASSRATFLAEHPGFDAARVVGDWTRDLAHGSDTINLNDALGNRVDHVQYGDGGPTNDVEPADGESDDTFAGSTWPDDADGSGRTLELVHPRLDNRAGAAWAAGPVGGTPGAANASFVAVPPPVVDAVEGSPAVPRSNQTVTVRCRVAATQAIALVEALWHREGSAASGTVTLRDDGLSGDGAAGDGEYAGAIPAQPAGAIVGFQVRARAADNKTTTVPRAPAVPPYGGFEGPYFLYQVLDVSPPVNPSESYYVVMTLADQGELEDRPEQSDVLLPCTFIHVARDGGTKVRYLAGIRYRGAQARQEERKSYRINFPAEDAFEDIQQLNLNASQIESEILAADLFRRSGMPYPQEWTVNLTFQGTLDPRYVRKEHLNEDFLNRFFGGASDSGNLYRALDPNGDPRAGDLTYYGEDPAEYVAYYQKRSNEEEGDYSDIIELCRAFDATQTSDELFPDVIEGLIDVNQWARYLALQSMLSNMDGSIQNLSGEDYFLYRVPFTSPRPDSGRWILVPWDLEESYSNADEALFPSRLVSVRRFLTHPRFAPLYYANLVNLRNGTCNRFETRQRFVLIDFLFGFNTIDGIDTYNTDRIGFVDTAVPVELSAGASTSVNAAELVRAGDTWTYWKGTAPPAGAPLAWTQAGYNDAAFESGPTGIGYADGDDATVLDDMEGGYTTVYARRTFTLTSPGSIRSLELSIDYDDGFVAFLNGQEVARRNAPGPPGSVVAFDDTAPQSREAGTAETIDLTALRGSLVAGTNVLAIQAINQDIDSSDLSLIPVLTSSEGASGGIGCGTVLYSTAPTIGLEGKSNGILTRSVRVAGVLATYDPFRATWSASATLGAGDNQIIVEAFSSENGTGVPFESRTITVRRLARAPTEVSGTLAGTTRWTEAGGPYLMTSDITIPAGSTLLIDPGTLVIGQAGASIVVRGEIQAIGTQAKPILFRAMSCTNRWGGIGIDATGTGAAAVRHTLRYCDFEFGDSAPGFAGCIAPVDARLLVESCSFRFLTANAIDGTNARLEVHNSLFEKIAEGVHCTDSITSILDSTFFSMVGDKDGIDFDGDGLEISRIERCLIDTSADDGIDLTAATVDIRDNVIVNCGDKAMSLEINGQLGGPILVGNVVLSSGTAFSLKSGVTINEAHHNTAVGNQEGVNCYAKAGAPDGGHGVFHSMIVWNNIVDVKLDALSTVEFSYSNISSGVFTGTGNISSDPRFVDIGELDVRLRPGSPCIGTGKDGSDMGAIPFDGAVPTFVRADADGNGSLALTDAIVTLTYLFRNGAQPECLDAADSNDDAVVDIADPVYTLLSLYAGGSPPPAPYPTAGEDPTVDALGCSR